MQKKNEKSFEAKLNRLEEISEKLESGDIGLSESIELYEEGINLSKRCYETLKNAEVKVKELQKKLADEFNDELDFEE